MRIIAGSLASRQFDSPKGHKTHPMSEKMRGALFNVLGDIDGLTVFDAFAGSGALSFEAISQGAKSALMTDNDKNTFDVLTKNIETLGLKGRAKAVRANASGWSDNNLKALFDLIFLDPPYDDLQLRLMQKLTKHLKSSGVLVMSFPGNLEPAGLSGLKRVEQKNYGDGQLVFYRKI